MAIKKMPRSAMIRPSRAAPSCLSQPICTLAAAGVGRGAPPGAGVIAGSESVLVRVKEYCGAVESELVLGADSGEDFGLAAHSGCRFGESERINNRLQKAPPTGNQNSVYPAARRIGETSLRLPFLGCVGSLCPSCHCASRSSSTSARRRFRSTCSSGFAPCGSRARRRLSRASVL